MSAYVIVQIRIRDAATYEQYKLLAPPSIAAYGGRYIARGGTTVTLEGDWQPARLVILEFPDLDKARAWWASPEYAEAKALRQSVSDADMVAIEGSAG
jgi:uncharacterized protein (DUF1330 family)